MAEETTAEFILRRHAELSAQISALKGQLGPKEAELEQLEKMLDLMGLVENRRNALTGEYVSALRPFLDSPGANALVAGAGSALSQLAAAADYSRMTIKQAVVQALIDHFPKGARTTELREFMKSGYGKEVEQSSLRPQLHRLKADGVLSFDPENQTWNLHPRKRVLYTMYNHPTSRAAMKELQDDPLAVENSPDPDETESRGDRWYDKK
jgi:hypothetical protein